MPHVSDAISKDFPTITCRDCKFKGIAAPAGEDLTCRHPSNSSSDKLVSPDDTCGYGAYGEEFRQLDDFR